MASNAEYYDHLKTTFDPAYHDLIKAIDVVKALIRRRNAVLYGGSAIDYALRLRGDSIYPDDMLAVPDLDFFSPENVTDSYALADELFALGYVGARSINAEHMETMRVDLRDNHWIADITYRPKEIFDRLPYIEYDGMRVIHPDFQRIDAHSSLAFPYDNPPREVIFSRWSKDFERFNKLAASYPIESTGPDEVKLAPVKTSATGYVLSGLAAYAATYGQFVREMTALGRPIPDDVIAAKFTADDGSITFDGLGRLEIIHFDIEKAAGELGGGSAHFEPYINLIPERIETADTTIYSTAGRLAAINSVEVGAEKRVRMVGVQGQLRHLLSMRHAITMGYVVAGAHADIYLNRYVSLMRMINHIEAAGGLVLGSTNSTADHSIFMPSVQIYGTENASLSHLVALARVDTDIKGTPMYRLPQNYTPGRANGRPPPAFSPDDIVFFQESGKRKGSVDGTDGIATTTNAATKGK